MEVKIPNMCSVITVAMLFFSLSLYAQNIRLESRMVEISNGDNSPTTLDYTDFGTIGITTQFVTREFWIENTGSSDLEITGNITSSDNQFEITQPNFTTVPQGGRVVFSITYDPLASGSHVATISIPSNDAGNNPFTFDVSGEGTSLIDNDNDGVPDNVDLDDDNDGVLDAEEFRCRSDSNLIFVEDFGQG